MKLNKTHLLPAGLALFAIAAMGLLADKTWSEKQQQLDLITNVYKDHLSRLEVRQASQMPAGFYSHELESLVTANSHLCDSLSRGDEICGYGADGDVFLDTQETGPGLDFEKSGFKAERSGDDAVEVSFNVYPERGEAYARRLTYQLVREGSGWRVDDVRFANGATMRQEIGRENEAVLASASDLADTASWVFHYLGNEDAMERATRFIAFPVQVCDEYGSCTGMRKDDPRLLQALDALRSVYYGHAPGEEGLRLPPKVAQVAAAEGKVVAVDALDFSFQARAWWITKIDLSRVTAQR
jgi:hypothetical protein